MFFCPERFASPVFIASSSADKMVDLLQSFWFLVWKVLCALFASCIIAMPAPTLSVSSFGSVCVDINASLVFVSVELGLDFSLRSFFFWKAFHMKAKCYFWLDPGC